MSHNYERIHLRYRTSAKASEAESFSKATGRIIISPAAVSQQVRALEHAVGHALFTRGPSQVRLTSIGRAFLPTVSEALNAIEARAATLFGVHGRDTLTIRATQIFASSWLVSRLSAFKSANPNTAVHLFSDASLKAERQDDADIKIVFADTDPQWPRQEYLFGETLNPVATGDIADQLGQIEDLENFPLLEIVDHRAGWLHLLEERSLALNKLELLLTDRTDLALLMASQGLGIALARAPATNELVRKFGLVRCLEPLERAGMYDYYLSYRSSSRLSGPAEKFRQWILAEAQTLRDKGSRSLL